MLKQRLYQQAQAKVGFQTQISLPSVRVMTLQQQVVALLICSVADGTFDGFADFSSGLALWDYAGAALICSESGVVISETNGTKLDFENLLKSPASRIRLLAAGTQSLHENLIDSVDV